MSAPEPPAPPVQLTTEQVRQLTEQLADCRHNINNHLALIISAAELAGFKPEAAARMSRTAVEQCHRVNQEMAALSQILERLLSTPGGGIPGTPPAGPFR